MITPPTDPDKTPLFYQSGQGFSDAYLAAMKDPATIAEGLYYIETYANDITHWRTDSVKVLQLSEKIKACVRVMERIK